MKLYWGPYSCAIGIHILLEEPGKPYETEKLDVGGGATHAPPFLSVNPKGKVPTLMRDDGSVLTEFGAIATWLARTNPERDLLPADPEIEARAAETIAYVTGSIHGQGYARLFKPQTFEPQDTVHGTLGIGQSAVKTHIMMPLRSWHAIARSVPIVPLAMLLDVACRLCAIPNKASTQCSHYFRVARDRFA